MAMLERGTVCYATRGRQAGTKVIVMDNAVKNGVIKVLTPSGEKKANIRHLFPTAKKVKIGEAADTKKLFRDLKESE